ncbi:ABC transporter family protein [Enterobacter hormaechei]|uniref:peptidase domain-containing ABC transporter n=1 Tax=Enterobacter hormaechei TaxID=158836 RepID=UPI0005EE25F8|nr:cysteine peptidase family C39 domain-containing protein [Enterobacter hormaechei]KJO80852.1 bacteriocin/lantibiotic ABC transporter [Enterobacter hormaechei subsp. xiangfangensis]KJP34896.1 bacteriocin/lantibiotic ABC transporter [Enterobacter hormaechei subsp. xiangfangensis]RCG83010.1 ABC transporter family protein [Enterobacter hormaechei]
MFSLFQYKKQGKTPVIRQHEFTECGLACLAMVLGHYDHHVSVSQLRREISVSADAGTSMAELMTLASDKNMSGRVLKGEITEIETSELPLIAFWRGNHFVVIVKIDSRSVTVHDPASGVRRYRLKEAEKLFSGYVLELKPTPCFEKKSPDETLTLGRLANKSPSLFQRQLLLTMLLMGVFFLIRFSLIGPYQRAVDDSIERTAQYESLLVETQKGIITLKANNMEQARDAVMDKSQREHIAGLMRKERLLARFDVASLLVINAEQLLVVCFGAWLILEGQMSIGMLYAYISYKRYFSDAMVQVAQKLLDKNALKGPLDRVGDLLFAPSETSQFGKRIVTSPVCLQFEDVSFAYPSREATLQHINMTLKQGEEAVIVGQSGSGKTTLLRLISGMLLASSGTLRINKIPIDECDLSSLRQHIRIVHADDILFTGSILDNIACFDSAPDKEQVIAACRLAEVDHVVARLPHGYETEMLPGNTFFSAGEMQRLVLARALYSQPKLLLCDEVTANLDKTTAQKVLANLRSLGIGLVFVTHSPDVVGCQGRLYTMENGTLRESEQ